MELSAKDLAWIAEFRRLLWQKISVDLPCGEVTERFDDYLVTRVTDDGMVHLMHHSDQTRVNFHVASVHFIYPPDLPKPTVD